MFSMQMNIVSFIMFIVITYIFSLKDKEAKDVRLRFVVTAITWTILMYYFNK